MAMLSNIVRQRLQLCIETAQDHNKDLDLYDIYTQP